MKKICLLLSVLFLVGSLSAQATVEDKSYASVLASTSWTAAFADLAGVDDLDFLAPASLRHPPEYELTPSDIVKVRSAKVLVVAGYEKMMATITDSLASLGSEVVKITTENSIEKVKSETEKIASVTKTIPRIGSYIKTVEEGRRMVASSSKGKKVLCHKMQQPLAKDLGLEIAGTFGPAPVSAAQIQDAKEGGYDFIIDNVHNPVAGPFQEVTDIPVLTWRNFPEQVEKGMLEEVVRENIKALEEIL